MPDAALALHITLYHSIRSKYKCYTANVCNKRNPSLYFNIFSDWADAGTIELYKFMRAYTCALQLRETKQAFSSFRNNFKMFPF